MKVTSPMVVKTANGVAISNKPAPSMKMLLRLSAKIVSGSLWITVMAQSGKL